MTESVPSIPPPGPPPLSRDGLITAMVVFAGLAALAFAKAAHVDEEIREVGTLVLVLVAGGLAPFSPALLERLSRKKGDDDA